MLNRRTAVQDTQQSLRDNENCSVSKSQIYVYTDIIINIHFLLTCVTVGLNLSVFLNNLW